MFTHDNAINDAKTMSLCIERGSDPAELLHAQAEGQGLWVGAIGISLIGWALALLALVG